MSEGAGSLADALARASVELRAAYAAPPASCDEAELRVRIVQLAAMAGVEDDGLEAVLKDFERNRALARVVRRLLGGPTLPDGRGRRTSYGVGDFASVVAARRQGKKGDEVYELAAAAAKVSGREVAPESVARSERRVRAAVKRDGLAHLFKPRTE